MKQSIRGCLLLCILTILIAILPGLPVFAASASLTITQVSEQVLKGSNCTIAVLVSATDTLESVNFTLTYDSTYLQCISENSLYELGDSSITVHDAGLTDKNVRERKYVLQFKALKKGKTKLDIEGIPVIYASSDNSALSLSKQNLTLVVSDKKKKSDNNKLASLKVKEGTLSKEFDPDTTDYEISMPFENSQIHVMAEAEDDTAKVKVTGEKDLKVGTNLIFITVTSASGKVNEYRLYVHRNEKDSDGNNMEPGTSSVPQDSIAPETTEPYEPEKVTKYQITKENGLIHFNGETSYLLLEPYDDSNVPTGYKKVSLELSGVPITAYALDGNVYQEFVLIYAKQEGKDPAWYQFDQTEGTLQRYNGITVTETQEKKSSVSDIERKEYEEKLDLYKLIIGVLICFVILLLILVVTLFMRQKGYTEDLE